MALPALTSNTLAAETSGPGYRLGFGSGKFKDVFQAAVTFEVRAPRIARIRHFELATGAKFGRDDQASIALRIQHTSNGGLHTPNPGLDTIGINFSVRR